MRSDGGLVMRQGWARGAVNWKIIWLSPEDTLLPVTTVSFTALQFNAVKKQFVAACKVPLP